MSKISVNVPDELLDAVRGATEPGDLDALVVRALRHEIANLEVDRLLHEIADEFGPIPPELVAEADAAWRAS